MKVLFGVTGGVASKLTSKLIKKLIDAGHEVKVVVTGSVKYFWENQDVDVEVYTDKDEWMGEKYAPDMPIAHIELSKWADVLLISPLTANTLAKIALGLADNLLTCAARAWDTEKPVIIAPAMNTKMWEHSITKKHINEIGCFYDLYIAFPVEKKLACGDVGKGAMAPIDEIVELVKIVSK